MNRFSLLLDLVAGIVGTQMVGMDFHTRLDTLMNLAGVRNADIAEVTGTDPSYVSRIRHGQRTPDNEPVWLLCDGAHNLVAPMQ